MKQSTKSQMSNDKIFINKEYSCINNKNNRKNKQKLNSSKLKNIDIVFLDDSDKTGCIERTEIYEKRFKKNLSVNQRMQVSFLIFLAITNLLVYIIAFCTGK